MIKQRKKLPQKTLFREKRLRVNEVFLCYYVGNHDIQYELEVENLKVRHLQRDEEWFEYIFSNRRGKLDSLMDYDVIIGPIANDTIFNTFGIITSGFLEKRKIT